MKIVSRSALLARINRRLAHEGERAHVAAPDSYYVVDVSGAEVCRGDDLEAFAREVGALRSNESLAS